MGFEQDITNCLQTLQIGGIILYPTDTIWGLGCDATNAAAVEKIFSLKRRKDGKSMIVLVAEEEEIQSYVSQPDTRIFEYLRTTNKPTSVVYHGARGLAYNLLAGDGSVAIRICRDAFCAELIKRFGKPIVSTSANFSDEPFPRFFSEISPGIRRGVDYVVQYRQEDKTLSSPSTLITWEHGQAVILRS